MAGHGCLTVMLAAEAVKLVGTLEFTWPLRITSETWVGPCCIQQQVRSESGRDYGGVSSWPRYVYKARLCLTEGLKLPLVAGADSAYSPSIIVLVA